MICDLQFGKVMLVSDLHGNGFDFRQILKVYAKLKKQEKADYLVFLGDLIHAYPGKQKDESVEIVEELLHLKANKKGSDVMCLLGNHEFVHIYHISLVRGHLEFTSYFENRIRKCRETIIRFFMDMPLMIRTQGGVLINHTGSSNRYLSKEDFDLQWLKNYHHDGDFKTHLQNIGKYDPQIGADFIETSVGDYLWDILMNGNEKQFGEKYEGCVDDLLKFASQDRSNSPMKTLVSGHIAADYGAETVGSKKLRLCSSAGCLGDLEKKYLLIDAEKEYNSAGELLDNCHDLY